MSTAVRISLFLAFALGPTIGPAQGPQWTTRIGGGGDDRIEWNWDTLIVAANGDTIVSGYTTSRPFHGRTPLGNQDGFLVRLSPNGAILWTALIGGYGADSVRAILEEPNGDLLIGGFTSQPAPLPATAGAFQTVHGGNGAVGYGDGFVARLTNAIQGPPTISWLTYLGGSGDESVVTLARHPSGLVVAGGWTESTNFPTAGAPYQPYLSGGKDGFVVVLDPSQTGSAQMPFGTFYGGSLEDVLVDVEVTAAGSIVAAGRTYSNNLPVTPNALNNSLGGSVDAFVAEFDLGLSGLTYGTYLGGNGADGLYSMVLGANDEIVLAGETRSTNFRVTAGAFQPTHGGGATYGSDCFVAILDRSRTGSAQLVYGTYLGGGGDDMIFDVLVEPSGLLTVVGAIGWDPPTGGFPTTPGAFDVTFHGGNSLSGPFDGFVSRLDPTQTGRAQLVYSTFLGGSTGWDAASQVARTPRGTVLVAGMTESTDFPGSPGNAGLRDSFAVEFDLLPSPVVRYGAPSPACPDGFYLSVNSQPFPGSTSFEVQATGAAPGNLGALCFGAPSPSPIALPGLGIDSWLLLAPPPCSVLTFADSLGRLRISAPIPPAYVWGSIGMQALSFGGPCAWLIASDALK